MDKQNKTKILRPWKRLKLLLVMGTLHFLFLGSVNLAASNSPVIPVYPASSDLNIEEQVLYQFVPLNQDTFSIDYLMKERYHQFQAADARGGNFGFERTVLYIHFQLFQTEDIDGNYLLQIENGILDDVSIYIQNGKRWDLRGRAGDQISYSSNTVHEPYFELPFELHTTDTISCVLRIKNEGEQFFVPLKIKSQEVAARDKTAFNFYYGIYFGILLFVFLFNLFISLVIRVRSSAYYVIYILGLAFLQFSLTGLSYHYLWPGNNWLAAHANAFFSSFSVFFLMLFSLEFLSINTYYPKLAKVYKVLAVVIGINTFLSLVNNHIVLYISILTINTITLLLTLLIIPTTILILRKGYKPARYFLLSFILLVSCVFIFVLRNAGVLGTSWFTLHCLEIGSLFEVILLSFAIVDKFKTFKDDAYTNLMELNRVKSEANIRLEKKVKERTEQLEMQKLLVESKNKSIIDSITYAKRIQEAILPPMFEVKEALPESFILYLPKDIVSGDFYWLSVTHNAIYVAAVDCTGHGVPGAIMSMIGHDMLNQLINGDQMNSPATILTELDKRLTSGLNRGNTSTQVNDGMDLALCKIDKKNATVTYAGAFRPLWHLNAQGLTEYKGTRAGIGGMNYRAKTFTEQVIPYQHRDRFYIFSDGYADQFGGELNKKFSTKRLKQIITDFQGTPMNAQHTKLKKTLTNWVGNNEYIDDILFMGFEL